MMFAFHRGLTNNGCTERTTRLTHPHHQSGYISQPLAIGPDRVSHLSWARGPLACPSWHNRTDPIMEVNKTSAQTQRLIARNERSNGRARPELIRRRCFKLQCCRTVRLVSRNNISQETTSLPLPVSSTRDSYQLLSPPSSSPNHSLGRLNKRLRGI